MDSHQRPWFPTIIRPFRVYSPAPIPQWVFSTFHFFFSLFGLLWRILFGICKAFLFVSVMGPSGISLEGVRVFFELVSLDDGWLANFISLTFPPFGSRENMGKLSGMELFQSCFSWTNLGSVLVRLQIFYIFCFKFLVLKYWDSNFFFLSFMFSVTKLGVGSLYIVLHA